MTSSVAAVERRSDPEWTQGDRFRKARTEAGYTQRAFADALEVKHATYAAWEADRTNCPRIQAVAKRVEMLTGVRAAWFLDVADPVPPDSAPFSRSPRTSGDDELSTGRNFPRDGGAVLIRPLFGASRPAVVASATTTIRERISA